MLTKYKNPLLFDDLHSGKLPASFIFPFTVMKKILSKILLVIICLPGILKVHSQEEWPKYYGLSANAKSFDLIECYDKGYIIAGSSKYGAYQPQGWLIKTDINGEILWDKWIGDGSYLTSNYSIAQTNDNGFIISGATQKINLNRDSFVLKLDACGNKEWCVIYPNNNLTFDYANGIVQNPDGTYTALVSYYGGNTAEERIWLFKLDQNGNTLWRKLYATDPDYLDEYGRSLIRVSDSGVLISGSNWMQVNGYPGQWWWTPFWIKVDLEGYTEWEFVWQENNYFGGECGQSIEDGYANFYGTGSNGYHPGVPCLYKFSATGQQIARYDMMGDTIEHGNTKTISMFHDSETLALGGGYAPNPDTSISLLWKTDTLGNILNQRTIPINGYPPVASIVTHDNKLLLTCYGQYLPPNNTEIILMKFNSNLEYDSIYTRPYTYDSLCPGTIISDTIQLDCDIVVILDEPALQPENNLLVFPNPASNVVRIQLPKNKMTVEKRHGMKITTIRPLDEKLELNITNLAGRQVFQHRLEKGVQQIELDISIWKAGIYLVILTGDEGFKSTEKLVVQ